MKGLYSTGATKLKNIFLAPLEAVIQADIDLSKRVSDFIMSYGFIDWKKQDENSIPYENGENIPKLKMVSFSYFNSEGKEVIFSIPVLSLIQLPLLHIKDAHFDMKVKMITVDVEDKAPPPLINSGKSIPHSTPSPNVKAFLTPTTGNNMDTMKSNMKVRLNMSNSDMPGGMIQLLAMMGEMNHIETKK
ncbi:DUF2589 domain-containing protein [Empedobacter brevis]|uniref:DUF2589 domain-containing protein n=1 Tax=Empedobacter brevis TaxID=247 RepID=UPI002FE078B5